MGSDCPKSINQSRRRWGTGLRKNKEDKIKLLQVANPMHSIKIFRRIRGGMGASSSMQSITRMTRPLSPRWSLTTASMSHPSSHPTTTQIKSSARTRRKLSETTPRLVSIQILPFWIRVIRCSLDPMELPTYPLPSLRTTIPTTRSVISARCRMSTSRCPWNSTRKILCRPLTARLQTKITPSSRSSSTTTQRAYKSMN